MPSLAEDSGKAEVLLDKLRKSKTAPEILDCFASIQQLVSNSLSPSGIASKNCKRAAGPPSYLAPFLIKHLKLSFQRLSEYREEAVLTAVVQHIDLAISTLQSIKTSLKGRRTELEIQRYTLVCKLIALHRYVPAGQQGLLLHNEICSTWGVQPAEQQSCSRKACRKGSLRMLPLPGAGEASEAVSVVAGNMCNLFLCALEGPEIVPGLLEQLFAVVESLQPWLRCAAEAYLDVLTKLTNVLLCFQGLS